MPAFALIPASPSDLENVAQVQFESCKDDPGFSSIFPKGNSLTSITHFAHAYQEDMENDPTCHVMVVKDALTGVIASFAIYHFFPPQSQEDIEQEMLMEEFPLPADANKELGNKLIHKSVRQRHEVVAENIGPGRPYVFLAAMGTTPNYQHQGAASLLLRWGIEHADDNNLPIYVEATSMALALYRKFGFEEVSHLKLDLSPWKLGKCANTCMIRHPTGTS